MNNQIICDSCGKHINRCDRYEKTFDLKDSVQNRKQVKVNGCSIKCLTEWYSTKDKWTREDLSLEIKPNARCFGGVC